MSEMAINIDGFISSKGEWTPENFLFPKSERGYPLGPMLNAIISLMTLAALRLAASCMAISQKGLMYMRVLVRSTELSLTLICMLVLLLFVLSNQRLF